MKRLVTVALAILGTALFCYWIRATGVAQIREALARIGWAFLIIILLGGAREAVRALAWTRTVTGPVTLPFRDAFAARLVGEALNTFVPMGVIVGEPAKADHVSDRLPFGTAFRALMIEFAFYTASLPLLFACAAVAIVPAAGALILSLIAVGAIIGPRLPLPGRLRALIGPLVEFGQLHLRRVWTIGACEVSYHLIAIVEVYVILALVAPHRTSWTSALVLETVNRGVTIVFKMLPMRIGVDEAGAAIVAGRLGIASTTGVTVALVRKLRLLVWNGIGLLIMFARSTRTFAPVPASGVAVRG